MGTTLNLQGTTTGSAPKPKVWSIRLSSRRSIGKIFARIWTSGTLISDHLEQSAIRNLFGSLHLSNSSCTLIHA